LQETQLFDQQWRERIAAYEAGVAGQLATLRAQTVKQSYATLAMSLQET
jgi:hypothetical protein